MKRVTLLVITSFAMIVGLEINGPHAAPVLGGPVPDGCVKDLYGKVSCPPMGGDIQVTLSGQAICGKGRCVRDPFGKVTCSSQPGGQITQAPTGNIMCAGGCEAASAAYCQQLR
jgi:hypothetical protein